MANIAKFGFTHVHTVKNPAYKKGKIAVPFRSCLLHNKSHDFSDTKYIETEPKWLTKLGYYEGYKETGEIVDRGTLETNNHKASNSRKIKALDKFCKEYQPQYEARKVSMLFYTFTQADKAKVDMKTCLTAIRERFRRRNKKIHGYIWTLEVSDKNHIHYHMALVTDRMSMKGQKMPTWLKADSIWGRRTGVEFVRKNIRHYMAKYFAKNSARVQGLRSYGVSYSKN